MRNNFYVYLHKNIITQEVFYIGKGINKRAWSKHKRSSFWNNYVNKHNGFIVEIYKEGLSEKDSFDLEKELISKYGRRDNESGILVNLTDGGEGSSGNILSKESKNKVSKNNGRYWLGRKIPLKTRVKISNTLRGRFTGKNSPNSKKVLNVKSGVIYDSLKEASIDTGVKYGTLSYRLNNKIGDLIWEK